WSGVMAPRVAESPCRGLALAPQQTRRLFLPQCAKAQDDGCGKVGRRARSAVQVMGLGFEAGGLLQIGLGCHGDSGQTFCTVSDPAEEGCSMRSSAALRSSQWTPAPGGKRTIWR